MLSSLAVENVNQLGEMLRRSLASASKGKWGKPFEFGKAPESDYWRGKASPRRNWIQLNGNVYGQPSYDNWKIQARFSVIPPSGFGKKNLHIYPWSFSSRVVTWGYRCLCNLV